MCGLMCLPQDGTTNNQKGNEKKLLETACFRICPPKFTCRNLNPNVMVLGGGAFER